MLAFTRSPGESQAAWEGLRQEVDRRGLHGAPLSLVVTDGCPGLAAARQTVYPRVPHQRGWVHKLRHRLARVRPQDHAAVKADVQAIDQAASLREAPAAARQVRQRWQEASPQVGRSVERDLPELLAFYHGPWALWRKLRTTTIIERGLVEVRRRTRPMVGFVQVQRVDRILSSIVTRVNLAWAQHPLRAFTQAA